MDPRDDKIETPPADAPETAGDPAVTEPAAEATTTGWPSAGAEEIPSAGRGAQMLAQLQGMIDDVAHQARPVLREVAAKAAELAAIAGEKAGPLAHKAAEVTEEVGGKVAARGKELAAELRRDGDGRQATDASAVSESTEPQAGSVVEHHDEALGE
ncbi:MAG: hypothetical protein ACXWMU_00320 [Candidatus Limnocylindrales bacterium]